jgi:phosphoglycolate phosphatase
MELYEKFKKMKIFFDLDGTLIDSKLRLYSLFQELVPESNLTYEEYWKYKKSKFSHLMLLNQIFNFDQNKIEEFEIKWMKLIETDSSLKLDKPIEGATEYLIQLKEKGIILSIVTARQYKEKVFSQLTQFGWENIFNEVLVTEQINKKEELIKPFLSPCNDNWIIGDTGMDINVGKKLGIKTVAVLSGFQNEEVLSSYKPDYIFKNIIEFTSEKVTDFN